MEKKHESNAARQKAYRARKRNAQSTSSRRSPAMPPRVTVAPSTYDRHRMLLGDFGRGPVHAYVVCYSADCPHCVGQRDPRFPLT